MRLVYSTQAAALPRRTENTIPVLLYGMEAAPDRAGRIGRNAFEAVQKLDQPVSTAAFDFLTLALAVTAAETFVPRTMAADGWARELDLVVPLQDPAPWLPVQGRLVEVLRFLTGDIWSLNIVDGGCAAPPPRRGRHTIRVAGHDSVCLFSGGLDSAIGAIDLTTRGRRPLLVSHAYRDDGPKQEAVQAHLPGGPERFYAVANPTQSVADQRDISMRGRSLNFLAFATIVASALRGGENGDDVEVVVPENGLIALNPPATLRRLGSLSTRTTHLYFLSGLEQVLRAAGLPVRLVNPYRHATKGEMIRSCEDPALLQRIAATTVSCGKWKRHRIQCGKCVPCLIRRASFHSAGWGADPTLYSPLGNDLTHLLRNGAPEQRADLLALQRAAGLVETPELERRVALTGPLPLEPEERERYVDVARRGLREIGAFLASEMGRLPAGQEAA